MAFSERVSSDESIVQLDEGLLLVFMDNVQLMHINLKCIARCGILIPYGHIIAHCLIYVDVYM